MERIGPVNKTFFTQIVRPALLAGAAVYFSLAVTGEAMAQRSYRPANPTISPYLNLTRVNNGSLPNYYSLVRPELEQRQINRQAAALARQQGNQLIQLGNRVQKGLVPAAPTGKSSQFLTVGPEFQNYGSYFLNR
jgi:hypothetical protein